MKGIPAYRLESSDLSFYYTIIGEGKNGRVYCDKRGFTVIVTPRDSTASSNKQIKESMKGSGQNYRVRDFIDASYSQIYRSTEWSIWNYHVLL